VPLAALNLSDYNAKMIMNRAEAMSCGGCHQKSIDAEIAPNVIWPKSQSFVHEPSNSLMRLNLDLLA
jgi:hypothetical protein